MTARISARDLTLDVPLFVQRERRVSSWASMFLGAAFDPPSRTTARILDSVSFEVREGDRLAILGRNGAGKSTLLRVLNQVYQPTRGTLDIQGTCQALLNLGLGFNGEATVRENVYLRGVAMGLGTGFLAKQLDSILEFSGLREKASHRLRTLSSGQRLRLGFAISTSVQHDIMLMDEWVGAGDAEFVARARERMQSRVGGSKIVILASHSVGLLRDVCNKGILLERGRVMYRGDIVSALKAYHDLLGTVRQGESIDGPEESGVAAMTYGCVEEISIDPGEIRLRGWMINSDGRVPSGLAMQVKGLRYEASDMTYYPRPDVARHLGLGNEECGFRAIFKLQSAFSSRDIGVDFQVLGGDSFDFADHPLRLSGAARSAISTT